MNIACNKSFALNLDGLFAKYPDGTLTYGKLGRKSDGTPKLVMNERPFVYSGDRCCIVPRSEGGYALKDLDSFGTELFALSEDEARLISEASISE